MRFFTVASNGTDHLSVFHKLVVFGRLVCSALRPVFCTIFTGSAVVGCPSNRRRTQDQIGKNVGLGVSIVC